MTMSAGFQVLFRETPEIMEAWMNVDQVLSEHSALDPKTAELAYLAVLAALGLERGIAFHATIAKQRGASRAEVLSAILVGLPVAGARVIECTTEALRSFDEHEKTN
jgi:alkylhydroperoxidase/carboxymuconolactone decarboxylase family protein YurZ